MECEHCKLVLKSKYNLKAHLSNNKSCLKIRGLEMESKFTCKDCNLSFINNVSLNTHFEICKRKELNKDKNALIKEQELKLKEQEIQHKKEILEMKTQLDKMFSTIEKLIDKPTSTTTNVTMTTNNVRNIYSDKYFLDKLTPEEIKKKCENYLTEQVFFSGQKGIAQLCTDHIIKTKDNKVLLTCSDVSRKKFKYMDENGNLKEDYEARTFTDKVFEPIKKASQVVYENILSDIKDEQEREEIDYNRKSVLNDKTMKAIDCFAQIVNIDNPSSNSDFKNELAILNK